MRLRRRTRVSSKGQVVIPVELRHRMGLQPGDDLVLHLIGDRVLVAERAAPTECEAVLEGLGAGADADNLSAEQVARTVEQASGLPQEQPRDLPPRLRRRLEAAVRAIVDHARPERILLFGSWATGRARPDSDVDLLVVADTPSRMRLASELLALVRPLLAPHGVDLTVCTPRGWEQGRRLPGFIPHEAQREGVQLYAA